MKNTDTFFLYIGGGTRTIKIDLGQDDEEEHSKTTTVVKFLVN